MGSVKLKPPNRGDNMIRVTSVTAVLLCLSHGVPQSYRFGPRETFSSPNRRLSSLVKQYYDNINDVDNFKLKTRYSSLTGIGATKYDNVVEETRTQADNLKTTLRNLAANSKASKYMNKIFQAGDCVKTVEEAIYAIERGTAIIERAEPELRQLISTASSIDDNSDIIEVTKTSVDILRQLETLMPKLAPSNSDICGSSFYTAFEALQTVGNVFYEVSEDRSLDLSTVTSLELKISRQIVNSVNSFLKKLTQTFTDLEANCNSDKSYNVRSLQAIGRMLNDLADLFNELGDHEGETEIREKTKLTNKVTDVISKLPNTSVPGLNCNNPGDFKTTARSLEDLVKLIEEVGINKLKNQLGLQGIF